MFGLALGCIGLNRREFQGLTPDEFNAVYQQWNQFETARYRSGWEQARLVAHCSVMPHTRRTLRATDLICFDWDCEASPNTVSLATRSDYERMRRKFGERGDS